MSRHSLKTFLLAASFLIACPMVNSGSARAQETLSDCEGCADNGPIGRYPQSALVGYQKHAFDRSTFVASATSPDGTPPQTVSIEGQRSEFFYFIPEGRSGLEVFLNYRQALVQAGYAISWSCSGADECGDDFANHAVQTMHLSLDNSTEAREGIADAEEPRYLLASRAATSPRTFVAVMTADLPLHAPPRAGAYVLIAQETAMDRGLSVTDGKKLEEELSRTGVASVYGIHFDFDRATLRDESEKQLREIATALSDQPQLRLAIVGHTDNVGGDAYNLSLSRARAIAVSDWLVSHGIAADRLSADGKGATEPVAGNDSDDGRAKNRRVELRRMN